MNTCKHFGRCGGCTYLDIPYEQELAQKEQNLRETLSTHAPKLEKLIPAPSPTGYRNKMELAFGDEGKDGQLALGIRKRRSFYEVATTENCVLIPDDMKRIAQCVQDYFRQTGEAFFHRKRHIGSLRHLVLRRGEFTGENLIVLSTTSTLVAPLEPLVAKLLALPLDGEIVGILHSVNDGVADAVKDESTRILHGRDYYKEWICGLDFNVSAYSFFQTNSAGAETLYSVVNQLAATDEGALAYDLYCGTGTIAQVLSPHYGRVIGVELNPDAISAAKENARLNGISNCEYFAGDVLHVLNDNAELANIPSVAVVDPPRDGLHPKALGKLIALAPPRLVYVACKPASLARDLGPLTQAGYELVTAVGVDMFPRTPHVECVALLVKVE